MKLSTMKILLFLNCIVVLLNFGQTLDCGNPDPSEYCVSKTYTKDKLPPNPPLNISMSLSISVRTIYIPWKDDLRSTVENKLVLKTQDSSVFLLQEVSGVDDAALSISIRLTFYVFWNDSRVIRLKDGDLNIQLGSAALEKYFLPDFYIYNLLDFKQSEFADPLKALLLTPEGKMW